MSRELQLTALARLDLQNPAHKSYAANAEQYSARVCLWDLVAAALAQERQLLR